MTRVRAEISLSSGDDKMLYLPLEYPGELWEGRHPNFMVL